MCDRTGEDVVLCDCVVEQFFLCEAAMSGTL